MSWRWFICSDPVTVRYKVGCRLESIYVMKMGQLKLSEAQSQRGGPVVTMTDSNAYKKTKPLCFYSATK